MKKVFSLITGILLTLTAFSQAPHAFNYQAVLRDATGQVNADASVSIAIDIVQGSAVGTPVFSETHSATTNEFGLVTLAIGSENPDDFALIDWSNGPYFIKIAVDGSDFGTSQLLSVPYARYAESAGNSFSGSFNDLGDVPANLDTNAGDDFDGDYGSLSNKPDLSGFLTSEADGSTTNELQMLSISGDTIFLTGGGFVRLPEGATVSFNDLADLPANLDTSTTDDFSGDYGSLENLPDWSDSLVAHTPDLTGYDSDVSDDFSGDYNDLTGAPNIADSISAYDFSGSFNDLSGVPPNLDTDATDDFDGKYGSLTDLPDWSDSLNAHVFAPDLTGYDSDVSDDFSGNYNDLTGAPDIADSISTHGFSGSFNDLSDLPPNLDTDATDDFDGSYNSLSNLPDWSDSLNAQTPDLTGYDTNVSDDFSGDYNDLAGAPNIADSISALGFSGSFNDLGDVPVNLDTDATDDFDGDYDNLSNKPDLSVYTTTDTTLDESEVDAYVSDNGYAEQAALEDTAGVLRDDLAGKDNVLAKDNTDAFTPDAGYEPATKKYVDDAEPTTYSVGDFAKGGIVFWVDETGQHGLVCPKSDQGPSYGIRWYAGTDGFTRAYGDGPFSGKANTSIIIIAQISIGDDGDTYAARKCNEITINQGGITYGDWYLPSKGELNLMYQNKSSIDSTASAHSGDSFASNLYWSSTEDDDSHAWRQNFSDGSQVNPAKSTNSLVRAVRAF